VVVVVVMVVVVVVVSTAACVVVLVEVAVDGVLRHGVALRHTAALVVGGQPARGLGQQSGAEDVGQPALDLDGEAAVQQRVEGALQQGDGLREHHERLRDLHLQP
jgi:hypothetical protein